MLRNRDEKQVYVVFASTNSGMGRLIRRVTRYKYNHVAISLSKDLNILYSFARYNYDSPLVGGFVEESALRYFYNNGQAAEIRVYSLPATDEQYFQVKNIIESVKKDSKQYIYNTFSAMAAPMGKRIRLDRSYTCVEFVSTVLSRCGLVNGMEADGFYSIEKMERLLEGYLAYNGTIDYVAHADGWGADQYNKKNGKLRTCRRTVRHFGRLIYRVAQRQRAQ